SIELNGANEITEINNRNMATMPTLATHRLLQAKPNDQDAEDTTRVSARASPPDKGPTEGDPTTPTKGPGKGE
ncbi:MAG: hypothetical protein GY928_26945, partial [Colwellia sp.]|nr:hypothetical protein [Colwellia sp.]